MNDIDHNHNDFCKSLTVVGFGRTGVGVGDVAAGDPAGEPTGDPGAGGAASSDPVGAGPAVEEGPAAEGPAAAGGPAAAAAGSGGAARGRARRRRISVIRHSPGTLVCPLL